MRRPLFAPLLLSLMLAPAGAFAHPHVFIDTRLTFRLDEAGDLGAISLVWAFDDFSSMLMIEDMEMDKDGDGVLTHAELASLTAMFSDWPEDYQGDLYVTSNGRPVALSGPLDVAVDYQDGRIIMSHIRALPDRIDPVGGGIQAQVYDPAFYTLYELAGTPDIRGRQGCRMDVTRADIAAAQRKYGEELFRLTNDEILDQGKYPDVGGDFADVMRLECES